MVVDKINLNSSFVMIDTVSSVHLSVTLVQLIVLNRCAWLYILPSFNYNSIPILSYISLQFLGVFSIL